MFQFAKKSFKIQDNEDGSTTIYCKNSGNVLCVIPAKENSTVPRKVNVVAPQPARSSQARDWNEIESNYSTDEESSRFSEDAGTKPTTRESHCCLSPIPITEEGCQSEDYFNDSVTQNDFAKCLNLISKEQLRNEKFETLAAEYPLRLLSRSKAYRTLEGAPNEALQDLKLSDDMPLTSHLGMKILHLNETRNFVSDQKQMVSLKKYDSFCRVPFNTAKPSSCHFPKLRCREKKQYPVATTTKVMKQEANHFYTYGQRQRRERLRTLKTGLNTRARRLLRLCIGKSCSLSLKRISEAELDYWREKKLNKKWRSAINWFFPSKSTYASDSDDSDIEIVEIDDEPSSLLPRTVPAKQSVVPVPSKYKCTVSLPDVLTTIERRCNGYYVKNTSVHVPDYLEYLSWQNRHNLMQCGIQLGKDRTFLISSPSKFGLARLDDKTVLKVGELEIFPVASPANSVRRSAKIVPVIDLTDSDAEGSKVSVVPIQWKFNCHACRFRRCYSNIAERMVNIIIKNHMNLVHSEPDPTPFLFRYLDRKNHCMVIEAFADHQGDRET